MAHSSHCGSHDNSVACVVCIQLFWFLIFEECTSTTYLFADINNCNRYNVVKMDAYIRYVLTKYKMLHMFGGLLKPEYIIFSQTMPCTNVCSYLYGIRLCYEVSKIIFHLKIDARSN